MVNRHPPREIQSLEVIGDDRQRPRIEESDAESTPAEELLWEEINAVRLQALREDWDVLNSQEHLSTVI